MWYISFISISFPFRKFLRVREPFQCRVEFFLGLDISIYYFWGSRKKRKVCDKILYYYLRCTNALSKLYLCSTWTNLQFTSLRNRWNLNISWKNGWIFFLRRNNREKGITFWNLSAVDVDRVRACVGVERNYGRLSIEGVERPPPHHDKSWELAFGVGWIKRGENISRSNFEINVTSLITVKWK